MSNHVITHGKLFFFDKIHPSLLLVNTKSDTRNYSLHNVAQQNRIGRTVTCHLSLQIYKYMKMRQDIVSNSQVHKFAKKFVSFFFPSSWFQANGELIMNQN
jgi:hypothetical protein